MEGRLTPVLKLSKPEVLEPRRFLPILNVDLDIIDQAIGSISGGGMSNPMTTAGDLIVGGTSGLPTRLGIGSNGLVLSVVGGAVTWATAPSGAPSGPAGGDLSGTYPNPQILAGTIVDTDVAAANKDGVAATPSLRTLGAGAQQAAAGNHAHAGMLTNPMTTAQDLIVGGASGAPGRLGVGATGQVLTVSGGVVGWVAPVSGGMTNPMTALGDLIAGGTAGAPQRLAMGADGQQLAPAPGGLVWRTAPACRAYRTTSLSVASGSATLVPFDAERFDSDAIHDTVTANTRLTCRTAGVYLIWAGVQFAPGAGTYRLVQIVLNNGQAIALGQQPPAGAAVATALVVATCWSLAVGDYVEVVVMQDAGAPLNITANPTYSPEFAMARLG